MGNRIRIEVLEDRPFDVLKLGVCGELDIYSAPALVGYSFTRQEEGKAPVEFKMDAETLRSYDRFVIDLEHVEYVDSTAMGELIKLLKLRRKTLTLQVNPRI